MSHAKFESTLKDHVKDSQLKQIQKALDTIQGSRKWSRSFGTTLNDKIDDSKKTCDKMSFMNNVTHTKIIMKPLTLHAFYYKGGKCNHPIVDSLPMH